MRIGHVEFVCGEGGQGLNLADDVIGKEADGTGGEGWQTGETGGNVGGELALELSEDISFKGTRPAECGVGQGATVGCEALIGLNADEGVAANPLPALNRLQKEGLGQILSRLGVGSCQAQKGADWGLEIRDEGAVNGDEGVVLGEGGEVPLSRRCGVRMVNSSLL